MAKKYAYLVPCFLPSAVQYDYYNIYTCRIILFKKRILRANEIAELL